MRTVKISRRAFLTGLGLASTAALLSACNTVPASSHSGAAPSQPDSEARSSSAASEVPAQPILSVDEFPITDGSTACIPLIAQIMADTTGLDLETARSAGSTNGSPPMQAVPALSAPAMWPSSNSHKIRHISLTLLKSFAKLKKSLSAFFVSRF